jgi:hypothetical protein
MAEKLPATLPVAATPAQWGDAEDFGASGNLIEEKSVLVKMPFLIGNVKFNDGDFGPFVSLTCVDAANVEFILNDGSTGIYAQIVEKLHNAGLLSKDIEAPEIGEWDVRWACKRGLRVSKYSYTDDKGKERPAETYYIA